MEYIRRLVTIKLSWGYWLLHDSEKEIARVHIDTPNAKEVALEIAQTINAHDNLVVQRRKMLNALKLVVDELGVIICQNGHTSITRDVLTICREAIIAAESEAE